jgi:uncharacterized membrane protein YkoI
MRYATVILAAVACGGDEGKDGTTADVLASPDDAVAAATALTGGAADEAEEVSEDGYDLWEVEVAMPNGAELEVLLFRDSGELFEIEDLAGPFDYDALDPLPGQLTYSEARDLAFETVAGDQVAWEVKHDEGGDHDYFYEFYVREVGDQLWEIKLWADTGEVYVTEAVEGVD